MHMSGHIGVDIDAADDGLLTESEVRFWELEIWGSQTIPPDLVDAFPGLDSGPFYGRATSDSGSLTISDALEIDSHSITIPWYYNAGPVYRSISFGGPSAGGQSYGAYYDHAEYSGEGGDTCHVADECIWGVRWRRRTGLLSCCVKFIC